MSDEGLGFDDIHGDAEKSKPEENRKDCSGDSAEERDKKKCPEEIQATIEIEQLVERVLEEWKDFQFKPFFMTLLFSVLPAFWDFISDNLLGWEYLLGSNYIYQTKDPTSIPDKASCQLLDDSSTTLTYSCTIEPNLLFGIITLLIPFLPGIQWYATLKTNEHLFGKFITSLFFPFFMVFFKVRFSIIFPPVFFKCPCFRLAISSYRDPTPKI